jgi:pyruvate dehydrogenase E2 component (dihydrolipoamide acetyltransferase)
MAEFRMPSLGADMQAGTVVAWLKRPGDRLKRGDTIAEVDTEKGVIDVEVFSAGVLESIVVPVGTKVPVGTVMATIGDGQAAVAPRPAPVPPAPPETGEERPVPAAPRVSQPVPRVSRPAPIYAPGLAAAGRLKISPAARRRARELAIDPAGLPGTGRGGAITRADVEHAVGRPPVAGPAVREAAAPAAPPTTDRLARMRRTIAAAMSRSKREIPHYYLATTIDLGRAMAWLAERNAAVPVAERLLPGVVLLKAAAVALREVPELNAVWEGDRVVLRETAHVGVAIALRGGGLVILALHDTATRPLADLMAGLRDLTVRARAGRMKSSELADSTITVTSLGDRGVETVYGVIYPPQVAIVGFGRIVDRPWAVSGGLVVRPVVTATLAADHRVSDGHRGGLFLDAVDRLLQEPEKL